MILLRIDSHCHVFRATDSSLIINGLYQQFKGYGFAERIWEKIKKIKSIETDDNIKKTLFHIKNAELDKVVLLPLSIKENNIVKQWYESAPDIFIPFFNPPERDTDGKSISDVIQSAITEYNVKGLKIMLTFRKKKLNDEVILPALEVASNNKIPVLMHTGYPPPGTKKKVLSYSNPIHVEEIIDSFSNLKIILAHMGYPWVDIAISLAVQYPNIYLDISNLTYMMPNRLKELLLRAKEIIGLHKILFGTDGFVPEMIEIAAQYFDEADFLSQKEIDMILGLNMKKLLNL